MRSRSSLLVIVPILLLTAAVAAVLLGVDQLTRRRWHTLPGGTRVSVAGVLWGRADTAFTGRWWERPIYHLSGKARGREWFPTTAELPYPPGAGARAMVVWVAIPVVPRWSGSFPISLDAVDEHGCMFAGDFTDLQDEIVGEKGEPLYYAYSFATFPRSSVPITIRASVRGTTPTPILRVSNPAAPPAADWVTQALPARCAVEDLTVVLEDVERGTYWGGRTLKGRIRVLREGRDAPEWVCTTLKARDEGGNFEEFDAPMNYARDPLMGPDHDLRVVSPRARFEYPVSLCDREPAWKLTFELTDALRGRRAAEKVFTGEAAVEDWDNGYRKGSLSGGIPFTYRTEMPAHGERSLWGYVELPEKRLWLLPQLRNAAGWVGGAAYTRHWRNSGPSSWYRIPAGRRTRSKVRLRFLAYRSRIVEFTVRPPQ